MIGQPPEKFTPDEARRMCPKARTRCDFAELGRCGLADIPNMCSQFKIWIREIISRCPTVDEARKKLDGMGLGNYAP